MSSHRDGRGRGRVHKRLGGGERGRIGCTKGSVGGGRGRVHKRRRLATHLVGVLAPSLHFSSGNMRSACRLTRDFPRPARFSDPLLFASSSSRLFEDSDDLIGKHEILKHEEYLDVIVAHTYKKKEITFTPQKLISK